MLVGEFFLVGVVKIAGKMPRKRRRKLRTRRGRGGREGQSVSLFFFLEAEGKKIIYGAWWAQ